MFSWLFGRNEVLIKENQELRRELMEFRQREFRRNLLSPYRNDIIGKPLGSLGISGGPPLVASSQRLIMDNARP